MYQQRRERLMEQMGEGSLGLWIAPPARNRSADTDYIYRQSSDILYLTGCAHPESAVILRPSAKEERFVLFVQPRDVEKEVWNGRRPGPEKAQELYQADATYPIEELPKKIAEYLVGEERFYYRLGLDAAQDLKVLGWLEAVRRQRRTGSRTPSAILDPGELLNELRLLKDPTEAKLMRQSAKFTAEAHALAMAVVRPGMPEYQLEALIAYHFRKNGATSVAYNSIVGGGENATILHYTENENILKDGDLVLIDAGGEFNYYAADITRTFPVNGKFSSKQRDVYEVVLAAEKAAIESCQPGLRFSDVHDKAVRVLTEGLIELGALEGSADELIENVAYKPFYMHKTGHWLGMDVHDVGNYFETGATSRILKPGMVLTVEPGLYFNSHYNKEPAAETFHGIGIRVEDDILITEFGYENLTEDAPKEIADIEALAGTKELP